MTIFYSQSTAGFYDEEVHGPRKLLVPDPSFVPSEPAEGEDPESAPLIEIDNPDCKIPVDGIPVPVEVHQALLALQSEGKQIQADENGFPVAVDPPPLPTADALKRALSETRAARIPILDALAGIAGRAQRAGDSATAQAADTAAQALLNITQLPALVNATTYDEMKAAVLAQYHAIADGAPPSVQAAFLAILAP